MDYGRYLEDMYEAQTNMLHDEIFNTKEKESNDEN